MTTQYDTRRLELLKEVGDKIHTINQDITDRKAAIIEAQHRAREHGEFQRHHESQQESLKVSQLHELNRHDEAKLRVLRLDHENIGRGSHPELASLFQIGVIRGNTENHAELATAKAEFEQLVTPELKEAAQRYLDAKKAAEPLLPVPHLAETIAKAA